MIILGLDMSTKKTGYSLVDENNCIHEYGLIESDSKEVYSRIKDIYIGIKKIIDNNKIGMIVAEDVPVTSSKNLKVAKDLCLLQGVLIGLCYEYNILFYNYAPSSWRSILGLYDGTREGLKRDIQKQRAINYINENYDLNLQYFIRDTKINKSDDDIAEAICISLAYIKDIGGYNDELQNTIIDS